MFDYELIARANTSAPGTRLSFRLHRLPKTPAIMAAAMIATIWPGLPMTDSMLRSWVASYDGLPWWATYAWYIPLGVLPLPWMWLRWTAASKTAAAAHAAEQISTIAGLIDAGPTAGA